MLKWAALSSQLKHFAWLVASGLYFLLHFGHVFIWTTSLPKYILTAFSFSSTEEISMEMLPLPP